MERRATFDKNRELFVIVILCAVDCAKDVIQWQNRKIIELSTTGLKINNHVLVGCVFESMWRF